MPTKSGCCSAVCVQFVCVCVGVQYVCVQCVCVQYMGTVYGMHGTQLDPLLASYAAYVKAQQAAELPLSIPFYLLLSLSLPPDLWL